MNDAVAPYTPPAGCALRHVECWRALVVAGRTLARKPGGSVQGLRGIVKAGMKAALPYSERRLESPFMRLIKVLDGWSRLDGSLKPARALELGALAEAVAQALGDEHDPDVAARVVNPTRPRADLDN